MEAVCCCNTMTMVLFCDVKLILAFISAAFLSRCHDFVNAALHLDLSRSQWINRLWKYFLLVSNQGILSRLCIYAKSKKLKGWKGTADTVWILLMKHGALKSLLVVCDIKWVLGMFAFLGSHRHAHINKPLTEMYLESEKVLRTWKKMILIFPGDMSQFKL